MMSAAVAAASVAPPSIAQLPGMMPGIAPPPPSIMRPIFKGEGSGNLETQTKSGQRISCPLKHTSVSAQISGHVSRVTVKQLFANPLSEKIEAVYTFPLSDTGAVDDMLMKVGARTIHGTIKKREEAREIYESARASGHVASLLDQERPNIFTQSVANIEPNKEVEVTISYVDLLPYEAGTYTFAFPTVVGPRFNPGSPTGKQGLGFAPDTTVVPDASKITPHVALKGERAGHDISINVNIDSPISISNVQSQLHAVNVKTRDDRHAQVALVSKATIPNKDFVLTWAVATEHVRSGYLTHAKDGEGYFNLSIMPPKRPRADQVQPKEMIFLIDCSGSQTGKPLDKAKETMYYVLDHMNDDDTFQVISFNNGATELFSAPQKATAEMRKRAHTWIESLQARGGTWMQPAIEKACAIPADNNRLRIVTFMTDGFVGNDFKIIGLVKKLRGTSRWFPFGTGNSVNRFLIDAMAKEGGGEADYVYLNSSGAEVGKKFYAKIASPVLTDVKVDYDGLAVKEVFPNDLSDVWAERPLYITGRYNKPGNGKVTISGFSGGKPYKQEMAVEFPANNASNDVLGSIWARAKVDRLMSEDWLGAQGETGVNKELKDEIVRTALEHHIMTQYTSFVAVEQQTKTKDGKLVTVEVPVELPEGVSREGVFGEKETTMVLGQPGPGSHTVHARRSSHNTASRGIVGPTTVNLQSLSAGYGGGAGYGGSGTSVGGYLARGGMAPPPPAAPMVSMQMGWPTNAYSTGSSSRMMISGKGGMLMDRAAPTRWYKAPRQVTILEEVNKKEDRDQSKSKSSFEDAKLAELLSSDVKSWLIGTSTAGETMKVKVTFKTLSAARQKLNIKGLVVETQKDGSTEVIATLTRDALRQLLKLGTIVSITKAS